MKVCRRRRDTRTNQLSATLALIQGVNQRLDLWALERQAERDGEKRRSTRTAVAAAVICAVTSVSSWLLFFHSQGPPPVASDPGRIAIAALDAGSRELPIDVDAMFEATRTDSTSFTLAISRTSSVGSDPSPPTYALFFCGRLRQRGLKVTEVNGGAALALKAAAGASAVEWDSRLGRRADCSYAVVRVDGFQLLLHGESQSPLGKLSAARILYALPGLTTTVTAESLQGQRAEPLPHSATLDVSLIGVPSDLRITAASPQLPQSGQLGWSSSVAPNSGAGIPAQYRVAGTLETKENSAQTRVFFAGAFVGVAGAAFLWFVELVFLGLTRRPSQS
jgi:hypothetical protein